MFFMRHGQSVWNEINSKTGRDPEIHDPVLSERGRYQVEQAAMRLPSGKVDLIISSPYARAIQTASIIVAQVPIKILIEPLVGEQRLYNCDIGSHVEALQENWPAIDFSRVEKGEWWLPFPESRQDLTKRIRAFRDKYVWHDQADHILVVSHWYFIHAVTGTGLDNAEIVEA